MFMGKSIINPFRGEEEDVVSGTSEYVKTKSGDEKKRDAWSYWKKSNFVVIIETLGTSGIIATLIVLTSCTILLFQLIQGVPFELPKYLYEFTLLIIGYYFGRTVRFQRKKSEKTTRLGFTKK